MLLMAARIFVFAVLLFHSVFFALSSMVLVSKRDQHAPAAVLLGLLSMIATLCVPALW